MNQRLLAKKENRKRGTDCNLIIKPSPPPIETPICTINQMIRSPQTRQEPSISVAPSVTPDLYQKRSISAREWLSTSENDLAMPICLTQKDADNKEQFVSV